MCVRCGALSPDSFYTRSVARNGWAQFLFWWHPSKHKLIANAPACHQCARAMRFSRILRYVVQLVVFSAAAIVAIKLMPGGWKPYGKLVMVVTGFMCVAPLMAYEIIRPAWFDITLASKYVDYEFRDRVYARLFVLANFESLTPEFKAESARIVEGDPS